MITIYAPGRFCQDIEPAMEDWERDIDRGLETDADIIEVVQQYWDESREVKRGAGYAKRFDLTTPGQVRFLRKEAMYRCEYQRGGRRNAYGNESPESGKGSAAMQLISRCDAALAEMGE